MVIASRRTLPPGPPQRTISSWWLVAVPALLGGFFHLLGLSFFTVIFGAFALVFAVGSIAGLFEQRRQRRLAAARAGESICTFARAFDYRRTDTRVIRAVYEELQPVFSFPLRASDRIEEDLRFDPESMDLDVAPALAERTGRPLINTEHNPYYFRVHTVADLVHFFCAQPPSATPTA